MPTQHTPTRGWLVEFSHGTVDISEDNDGYSRTIEQRQQVVCAENEETLAEHLCDAFDPETDDGPKVICELPEHIVRACNAHEELLAALISLQREYKALARTGVERIRELGGNVDDAERMFEPVLGEITGTNAAIAKAEAK